MWKAKMIKRDLFGVMRYLALVAVLPLLLGHGMGDPCFITKSCPDEYVYVLYGHTPNDETLRISHQGALTLRYNDEDTPAYSAPAIPTQSGPYEFSLTDVKLKQLHVALFAGSERAGLSELWLRHDEKGEPIKLSEAMQGERAGSNLNFSFLIDDADFGQQQSSRIASGALYSLSAGSTGAEWLQLGTKADVYRNDELIFTTRNDIVVSSAPKMFAANTGDILRFHIEADAGFANTSELWLHRPDGFGIKLLHRARSDGVAMPLDFQFVIP